MKCALTHILVCSTAMLFFTQTQAYAQQHQHRTAKTSAVKAADRGAGKPHKKIKTSGRPNRNVVAGNTVVVNRNVDRGYGHPDYHHDWDDDDNDFGEFLGKTMAVTAGVAVTTAVIGEVFEDEPDNCQQQVSNGQVYMFCNGVWYQPVMQGSNVNYLVTPAPPSY